MKVVTMVQRDESYLTAEDHPLRAVEQHLRSAFRLWLERETDRAPYCKRPIDQFVSWSAQCFKSFVFSLETPEPESQKRLCEAVAGPEIASAWYEQVPGRPRSSTLPAVEDEDASELPLDPFEDLKRFAPRFHAVAQPSGETYRNADPHRQLRQAEYRDLIIATGQAAFHTRSIDFAVVLLELSASCFSQRMMLDGQRMTEEYFVENARRWFQSAAAARAYQQSDSSAIAYSFAPNGVVFSGEPRSRPERRGDDPEDKVETIPPAAGTPYELTDESETMEAAPLGDQPRTRFEQAVRDNFTRTLNDLGFDGPAILSELDRYPNVRQLSGKMVREAIQRSRANGTSLTHELKQCGAELLGKLES